MRPNWTSGQDEAVMLDLPLKEIAKRIGKTTDAVRQRRFVLRGGMKASPYQRYDEPPSIKADRILIVPDAEIPFHNADMINKAVDLALAWNVKVLLCAGDLFHLECLSGWEPGWKNIIASYMDEDTKDALIDLLNDLPRDKRQRGFEILEKTTEKTDSSFAEEVNESKKAIHALNVFSDKWHIMGNHEGRLLKTLNSNLEGQNLADIFCMKDWHTSEYYYATVESGGEVFRVAHPKPYGRNAPADMASRFLCHYLMGHSHDWSMRKDRSGKFWAISMGHCADEMRFPYEAQRDRTYWQHVPGAVIIRDGYPYLLSDNSQWDELKRIGA